MFTTSAIFTCATAPADAFAAAPPSGAAWRVCRTTPCAPAASTRAQNRAEVVRILDAVEHDDQRRRRSLRALTEIVELVERRRSTSATTP